MGCKWGEGGVRSLCEVFKDPSNMATGITLKKACGIKRFITLTGPREGAWHAQRGTQSPTAQSLVIAGRKRAKQGPIG